MIRSMTGFGKADCNLPDKNLRIEIKSLNSKQFDLISKLPSQFYDRELEIRSLLLEKLGRGKVFFTMNMEFSGEESPVVINKDLALRYHKDLIELAKRMQEEPGEYLPLVIRMPEVMKSEKQEIDDDEWKMIRKSILEAADNLDAFRKEEGAGLEKDLKLRIDLIENYLEEVVPLEKERIELLRSKLDQDLESIRDKAKSDPNRFEQELIFYIEKLDITEEKVRLKKHCTYFLETIESDSSEGKKLSFISQEIGREINTMGAKANHAGIQHLVVKMKDELEKIKEQLSNIL